MDWQSMEQKDTVSDTPLTGVPPDFFQIFQHKEVTCEKVARANLVEFPTKANVIQNRFDQKFDANDSFSDFQRHGLSNPKQPPKPVCCWQSSKAPVIFVQFFP